MPEWGQVKQVANLLGGPIGWQEGKGAQVGKMGKQELRGL